MLTGFLHTPHIHLHILFLSSTGTCVWMTATMSTKTRCKERETQKDNLDHLNITEPGVNVFTKEDEEGDVVTCIGFEIDSKCTIIWKKTCTNKIM